MLLFKVDGVGLMMMMRKTTISMLIAFHIHSRFNSNKSANTTARIKNSEVMTIIASINEDWTSMMRMDENCHKRACSGSNSSDLIDNRRHQQND